MESPRLWFWENRLKLLLMVSLLYSFLLSLLDPNVSYCCKTSCEAGATEPESGTATPRYRFPD